MQSEFIGLGRMPCEVETTRTLLLVADSILPTISGDEISTGIADGRNAEFFHQVNHILAEAISISGWMTRFVDASVYAASQMLDKGTEQTIIDRRDLKIIVDDQLRAIRFIFIHHFKSFRRFAVSTTL